MEHALSNRADSSPDETFSVHLSAPTNAVIADSDGIGTIVNDDTCAYLITPGSQSFTSPGGTGGVNVTANIGCAWTAVSNDAWIVVTSGNSGGGNGTVNYSVAVNAGLSRIGTITIAGQTFTVTQDAATPSGILQIIQSVIAGGGGQSNGGAFTVEGSIGQCLAGTESTIANYSVASGFWFSSEAVSASSRSPFDFGDDLKFNSIILRQPFTTRR